MLTFYLLFIILNFLNKFYIFKNCPTEIKFSWRHGSLYLLAVIIIPIFEEYLFIHLLANYLQSNYWTIVLLFSLFHLFNLRLEHATREAVAFQMLLCALLRVAILDLTWIGESYDLNGAVVLHVLYNGGNILLIFLMDNLWSWYGGKKTTEVGDFLQNNI